MQVGGNANASAFFHQHSCTTNDTNAKYSSRTAQLYRDKIRSLATQATRKYGTDLWIDGSGAPPLSPQEKEEDFFASHSSTRVVDQESSPQGTINPQQNSSENNSESKDENPEYGPSVDYLSVSPEASLANLEKVNTSGTAPNKEISCVMKKKPNQVKKGVGAKKCGLGAQKMSSKSFNEIEKQAQAVDKLKEAGKATEKEEPLGISHSVSSDMQIIQQETPTSAKSRKKYNDEDDLYFSCGNSRYFDSPDLRSSAFSKWDDNSDSFWKKESSSSRDLDMILSSKPTSYSERSSSRRKPEHENSASTDEAQKKFGNAKAISSDMYFGKQDHAEYEARIRLERLSGNAAISSADLFEDQKKQPSGNYNISNVLPAAPDMTQFKQGVKSVAGKLSVLANGVMTSIQDRYGS
ncbi:ADP-ribosylation factor GTPase-activating protein 3 [Ophiophagus hannah]|uniref:ADP-ribosylation factor GTPase-activating protein 3 n=1 Tax=Ophiophagus hannah TaxID=8665 RepID=V8NUE1_OPHHA|nr:ADP-ribosylation factor GTPase-activating protein 3 [Ophiophagus hannah]